MFDFDAYINLASCRSAFPAELCLGKIKASFCVDWGGGEEEEEEEEGGVKVVNFRKALRLVTS